MHLIYFVCHLGKLLVFLLPVFVLIDFFLTSFEALPVNDNEPTKMYEGLTLVENLEQYCLAKLCQINKKTTDKNIFLDM